MPKSKFVRVYLMAVSFILMAALIINCGRQRSRKQIPVRIGWQASRVIPGQVVQVLKRTSIPDRYPVKMEFKSFGDTGSFLEAIEADEADILLVEDQWAVTLLARDTSWTIVARLAYERLPLYVPPDSPIGAISDLKRKTVGLPMGTPAQREALKMLQNAGLNPPKDVRFLDLGMSEQADLVRKGSRSTWARVDALMGYDPAPARFEAQEKARVLGTGKAISVLLVSSAFLNRHAQIVPDVLAAFMDAHLFFAHHPDLACAWFSEEFHRDLSTKELKICAALEPNYRAMMKGQVSMNLSELDLSALQEAADFIFRQGLVSKRVDMRHYVDLDPLRRAEKSWWATGNLEPQIRKTVEGK